VGKSTLLNQILRQKVAITSERPQTTRNAIRGVRTDPRSQVVFVDTPGLHKPQTALGKKLNAVVRATLGEVDAVLFVLDGSVSIGRGDRFIAAELEDAAAAVVVALNKIDLIDPPRRREQEAAAAALGPWPVVACSARRGDGVGEVVDVIVERLPEGPLYYPPDAVTDQPERTLVAELIREKVLALLREEVPHSVAVVVEEMVVREDADLVDIEAIVYVERSSQKGIVIGKGGRTLKQIGTLARRDIEALLGSRVFLHLRVKVERDWQRRSALVDRFGYGR
jgi:GTP-binding protein Era